LSCFLFSKDRSQNDRQCFRPASSYSTHIAQQMFTVVLIFTPTHTTNYCII
jgi:hypothetical protein